MNVLFKKFKLGKFLCCEYLDRFSRSRLQKPNNKDRALGREQSKKQIFLMFSNFYFIH